MKAVIFFTLIIVSIEIVSALKKVTNPIIEIPDLGTIEGAYGQTAWTKRKYLKFIDVQYAETSTEGRFQAPKTVEPYEETYNANTKDLPCPSLKTLDDIISYGGEYDFEDCLHMTISTPNRSSSLPVMVYLAGYDLEDTENEENEPNYLLEKDVVLVTVQYRGGPLGFLSTLSERIPGNTGVLDVIEALRFIKKYIKSFGGDGNKVTLFGQYGNAALINILTMSPLIAKDDLFQKVIYQSGSALIDGMTTKDPLKYAKAFGKHLECKSVDDISELNKCFFAADVAALLYTFKDLQKEYGNFPYFTIGGPSGVLPDDPKELLAKGEFRGYPTMGGIVRHPAMGTGQLDNAEDEYNPFVLGLEKSIIKNVANEDYLKIVLKQFPSQVFKRVLMKSVWPGAVDLSSLDIKDSTTKALKYNAQKSDSYLYAFNYRGAYNRLPMSEDDGFNDVALTDDNIYLFPYTFYSTVLNKDDKAIAKIMVDLWTSFAIDGIPKSSHIIGKWPIMVKGTLGPYLKIDRVQEIGWNYTNEFFSTAVDTRLEFDLE